MKKLFQGILIFVLSCISFPASVYAQEAEASPITGEASISGLTAGLIVGTVVAGAVIGIAVSLSKGKSHHSIQHVHAH